ncbi:MULTISPECIES: hypothetical protein [Mycobacteroides]|uniref:hypothetical protein n=1 Tax=Mycobacteroides TaxID=670516 RepID=UPI00090FBF3B|nr:MULTISPECIES: hypothetical protein [Mycobacteroides]OHT67544.1 hypothetical protein BKG66_23040 [Mycobacteroides chelonae]OHT84101.1 hypothetical protein BKG70_21730 [Mycobacteroides chelonae]SHR77819.1 Uncharacterised protein [Mycobacteroides abscessus subsp. abscessus]SHS34817.1 Uncharacterised protein [Mycobacteroides abscessus subsp. abscessus]SHS47660.1 Uncharacterised protein [Mycobacteroides abscessus subsp. abscessus]
MLDIGRASTTVRVCIGVAAAAVICLLLMAVVKLLGWNGELQQPVLNFVYNSVLVLWVMWALRKRLVKGVIAYLLFFYAVAGMLAFSAVGLAVIEPRVADAFGTEIELVIDQCQPRGSQYICAAKTTERPPRAGVGTLSGFHEHGDIVRGTYYSGIFGGFAEGGHAPPRPAIGSSLAAAVALLAGILLVMWALVKALRTPRGSPVWEPKDSVFVNARLEPLFGWIGLLGAVVATAVSGYLFMAQLGAANETITAMGLSVGDWMTVASVMVGLVAWGYRKAETPFGKKVIAILSKATRIGLLCICAIGAIFAVLQSASLSRRFITTAPQAIWDSTEYIGRLQQGFTVPMLLAAAALLLAAHLMTLQFWEAGEALRQQSEASSVFRPDIQELIDFLAVHANGYERARLDERFPESEPILAQLHSIGLVVQVRKRPRLTSQGKRVATSNITGT